MTECNQSTFGFADHFSRQVVARFDGGTLTTDSGGFLLRETDHRLNLLPRLAECFLDARNPVFVEHSVEQLLAQRIYGLALGYEDLNDHEQLRRDPLLRVLAGKEDVEDSPLAGKSTLNRLELSDGTPHRYKKITFWKDSIDELLVKVFLESYATPPAEIILDVDATDFPLHGEQEGRFFHGYYDSYCYLPLYIFSGDQLLCARLRQSNSDAAAGGLAEIQRIVAQTRTAWPEVKIILRGDSGFCRNELMSWCEAKGVDYVFGFRCRTPDRLSRRCRRERPSRLSHSPRRRLRRLRSVPQFVMP
jgi:Transposase DDE domain group 1